MQSVVKIVNDLQNLFFPGSCLCCNAILPVREQLVCVTCLHQLPLTQFTDRPENAVERVFFGRSRIHHGTALLWFHKKGPVQHLIHQLKYRGQQQVGSWLGHWMADEIRRSSRFEDIDLVLPMPLQKKKKRKRGYNQTSAFAATLASDLDIRFEENLLRRTDRSAPFAFRGRAKRALEKGPEFEADPVILSNYKHVLLTDDVITTGTTLEAAVNTLRKAGDVKVSIATMAITA